MNELPNKIRLLSYTGDINESLVYDKENYIDIPKDSVIIVLTKTPTEYSQKSEENAKQDKDHLKYAFIYVDPSNNILNYGRQMTVKISETEKTSETTVKNPMHDTSANTPEKDVLVNNAVNFEPQFELFDVTVGNKRNDYISNAFYHIKRLDTKELKNTDDSKIFENDILDFLNKTKIDIQFTQTQPKTGWFKGGDYNISNKTKKNPTRNMIHNRTIKNLVNI